MLPEARGGLRSGAGCRARAPAGASPYLGTINIWGNMGGLVRGSLLNVVRAAAVLVDLNASIFP